MHFKEKVDRTREVANACIYVENVIGCLQDFHILYLHLPQLLAHLASQILCVCVATTNLLRPIAQYHCTDASICFHSSLWTSVSELQEVL